MKDIVIVGAGGQGKMLVDLIESCGKYKIMGYYDDTKPLLNRVEGYPILFNRDNIQGLCHVQYVCLALGQNFVRHQFVKRLKGINKHITFPKLIDFIKK